MAANLSLSTGPEFWIVGPAGAAEACWTERGLPPPKVGTIGGGTKEPCWLLSGRGGASYSSLIDFSPAIIPYGTRRPIWRTIGEINFSRTVIALSCASFVSFSFINAASALGLANNSVIFLMRWDSGPLNKNLCTSSEPVCSAIKPPPIWGNPNRLFSLFCTAPPAVAPKIRV